MKLYYNEIGKLIGEKQKLDLDRLDTDPFKEVLGRFIEGLLLNECITIPIGGPAVEVAAIVHWFGQSGFDSFIEEGAIEFLFCPGTNAYITEENKKALLLKSGPGLLWAAAKNKEYFECDEAIQYSLVNHLNYPRGKARRVSNRILRATRSVNGNDSNTSIADTSYAIAQMLLEKDGKRYEIDDLKKLNNNKDKDLIRLLLNIAGTNRDLTNAVALGCSGIYGGDLTWEAVKGAIVPNLHLQNKNRFNMLLKFEGIPCISELIKMGWEPANVFKMRKDPNVKNFRVWLPSLPSEPEIDVIKGYYETFKDNLSSNIKTKIMRVGIPGLIGLLGPAGTSLSILASTVDTIWGDRIINGWNPKIFIDKHFGFE